MNGNTPFAGRPDVEPAGQSIDGAAALSVEQKRLLRRELARIATRTRSYLPDEYVVGSELSDGISGPQATVAVQPPLGYPVSADVAPDFDAPDGLVSDEERAELARDLAARAVYQVMSAVHDNVTPMAQ